jgi:type 1 glutamine amidotransferase
MVAACAAVLMVGTWSGADARQGSAVQQGQPEAQGRRGAGGRGAGPQNQIPKDSDVQAMMAALPDKAPARPKQPRKVLVLAKASGFVHSSIPLAARTVGEMGKKTGAWSTTVSYDSAVITTDNLKQYDAIFLASTTGAFLDDPDDQAVTAARRQALLDFVRGGKGLAGIHAAIDSYHGSAGAAAGRGAPAPGGGQAGASANPGTWPEFNKMIGAWFKFHWNDPQHITVKIDDPKSPLTAPFKGQSFGIDDETYTFARESWTRENVHVLTSIDYAKMSDEDKAKEPAATARTDQDYGLSWIRREGKGRVFVEAHGHSERIYAIKPMLEHVLAGIQYALGDLPADDSPSVRPGKGTR